MLFFCYNESVGIISAYMGVMLVNFDARLLIYIILRDFLRQF